MLEVPIQDRTTDDDGNGEKNELCGDDLGGVEALQRTIDIFDLKGRRRDQDGQEEICDGKGEDAPQSVGKKRCHALGRERRIST